MDRQLPISQQWRPSQQEECCQQVEGADPSPGETYLECWVWCWPIQSRRDMDILEWVQWRAIEVMKGLEHLSYEYRLVEPGQEKAQGKTLSKINLAEITDTDYWNMNKSFDKLLLVRSHNCLKILTPATRYKTLSGILKTLLLLSLLAFDFLLYAVILRELPHFITSNGDKKTAWTFVNLLGKQEFINENPHRQKWRSRADQGTAC